MKSPGGVLKTAVIIHSIETIKNNLSKEDQNHGIGKTVKNNKHKFHIIKYGSKYRVKKKFWKLYFYIRTKFKIIEFDDFSDALGFVVKEKRKEGKTNENKSQ
ncbi:MAG: hypothetical protein ACTSWK_01920 [Promethearchaeota archaeon]